MFKRGMLIAVRHPEALLLVTITPFLLMFLFGSVFGNIVDLGGINYLDFIVPGVILQSMGQASQHSAINVTTDMTNGIIDRFRSMSISKYSVLIGHIGVGVMRNTIATAVIIGSAFVLGLKPQGSLMDWLVIIAILILVNIAISSISVLCGLISKTPEGSSSLMFPLFVLPYISSGFVPVDTMSGWIKWFSEIQPMTPIIDSIRALMMDLPLGNSLWIALAWCLGITIVSFAFSLRIYNKKIS